MNYNTFSNILLISGSVNFFLGLILFSRFGKTVKWFGALMLCVAIWCIAYGFELASTTLDAMLTFTYIEYIGIAFIPAMWLMFTVEFSQLNKLLKPTNIFIIFLFPVMVMVMVLTNEYHHLHYRQVSLSTKGIIPTIVIVPGFWYYVHTVYFYTSLFLGNLILFKNQNLLKTQSRSIILASFIPWIANILYLSGIRPYDGIDITPYAFILTTAIISFSLIRFDLFAILPVAYERVISGMPQAIIIIDNHNKIVDLNKSMCSLLGVKRKMIKNKNVEDVLQPHPEWLKHILHPEEAEKDIILNDKYYQINYSTILDDNNKKNGYIFTAQNITERKLSEQTLQQQTEELQKLNTVKDKLFSIIAHDLRGPLASLMSLLDLAKQGNVSEKEFTQFAGMLSSNVGYTSNLIENLLFWSKSQLKGETINPQAFDVNEIINERIEYYIATAAEKNIRIINTIQSSFVFADKDMVQLIIRNLISNAIKFSKAGDTITISGTPQNNILCINIADTGVGMSKESIDKLFKSDIFSTRGTSNELGTGLGLLLCKEFIEKNGGTFHVESELGKGSTFSFTLKST
jgi:PAS domain S-box-containing protein